MTSELNKNVPAVAAPKKRRRKSVSLDKKKSRAGWLFVLPFVIGLVFIYLPVITNSIYSTFCTLTYPAGGGGSILVFDPENIWLNYRYAFVEHEWFYQTFFDTLADLVLDIPSIVIFSLFMALLLNQDMKGRALFRAIFFVPVILSAGLMETINANDIISDAAQGGVDDGSGMETGAGIISAMDFEALFSNMKVGKELVVYVVNLVNSIYDIINDSGVQMLIFLAGLQSISPSIYEACQIEGATGWETFWKITFPMISPMILVNSVYTLIDAFTKADNPIMGHIKDIFVPGERNSMYWIYFVIVMLLVGLVAAIASSFVFYQRKD